MKTSVMGVWSSLISLFQSVFRLSIFFTVFVSIANAQIFIPVKQKKSSEKEKQQILEHFYHQGGPHERPQPKMDLKDRNVPKGHGQKLFDDFFNRDFFNRDFDPFKMMKKMQEQFKDFFQDPMFGQDDFDSLFKKWYGKKFGGEVGEMSRKEDKKYIYYIIKIKNIDKDSLEINVDKDMITISGKTKIRQEEKSKHGSSIFHMESNFKRSFPVPKGTNPDKVKMDLKKDKLIIKFPK